MSKPKNTFSISVIWESNQLMKKRIKIPENCTCIQNALKKENQKMNTPNKEPGLGTWNLVIKVSSLLMDQKLDKTQGNGHKDMQGSVCTFQ